MLASFSKTEHSKKGKDIILSNPFYYTLYILLKYSFVKHDDFHVINFVEEITKSENEFKVFMVFKEYALYKYHTNLKEYLKIVFNKSKENNFFLFFLIRYKQKNPLELN